MSLVYVDEWFMDGAACASAHEVRNRPGQDLVTAAYLSAAHHLHHCPGCKHDAHCASPSCFIIRPGGDYGSSYGNPEKCGDCI